ncbi:YdeI/OmpD-associated family protein [Weissella coleopterorum]|uniref:YdeI/OmpD-associated family protein n=1 Tax=Weissella coleopterorum TaxID=2714949 RepID=A0A6G8B1U0_9LACO|nr:YdeI/OmpD-associated family protein [Weissella coleopterorum]QIL51192.1 YdeI/OmpD-associated family protein [Weissella coleopterorum]
MENKTIIEKLKLIQFKHPIVINPIEDDLVKRLKAQVNVLEATDLMIIFIKNVDELQNYFKRVQGLIEEGGVLAFAYAKKGNQRYTTYVHRDDLFPALRVDDDGYPENSLLKFNRMVKYDDDFTLVALKRTLQHEVTQKDARVADYEQYVPQIMKQLVGENRDFFQQLTPGYQKAWARYIYSAKTKATQDKHFDEMQKILAQGYKSKELYQRNRQI